MEKFAARRWLVDARDDLKSNLRDEKPGGILSKAGYAYVSSAFCQPNATLYQIIEYLVVEIGVDISNLHYSTLTNLWKGCDEEFRAEKAWQLPSRAEWQQLQLRKAKS